MEVTTYFRGCLRLQVPHVLVGHSTDDEQKDTVNVAAVLILGSAEMLHPHDIRHTETGNGTHSYKITSVCF
jgi:hypothetical protein